MTTPNNDPKLEILITTLESNMTTFFGESAPTAINAI